MRATARKPYRVYTQDQFFAEEGLFAAGEPGVGGGRDAHDGKSGESIGGGRVHRARRAAGAAMLIGAAGAVVIVLAIDALPHAGSSRRRGALLRVARVAAHGTGVPAQPLSRVRLPRALARQSRRGGRSARPARKRFIFAGPNSESKPAPRDGVAASRPAEVSADRGGGAHAELAASSQTPARSRPEEFGFER
jgi:hypothetical protein